MKMKGLLASTVAFFLIISSFIATANINENIYLKSVQTLNDRDYIVLNPTDDAHIRMNYPDSNGNGVQLAVKNRYGSSSHPENWEADTLVKFNLNSIPDNIIVNSASLNLYYFDYVDTNPVGRPLTVYRLANDWDESTVTWNNRPSISNYVTSENVPNSYGWMSFDVTSSIQKMVSGAQLNYGWQIMDETPWNDYNIPETRFRSKESGNNIPFIEIEYTEANDPPIANANGPYSADVNESILFDGSGSLDTDGSIIQYLWDFGDGSTETGITVQHSYTKPGDYKVTLTVMDNDADTATDYTSAYINNPPIADVNGPYTIKINEQLILDGTNSSDADGIIELFEWDLENDGEYDDAKGPTTQMTWNEKGEYTISLRVTDDDGSTDTDSTSVTVINLAPQKPSTPSGPSSGKVGKKCMFSTTTIEPDDDFIWYKWSWGDETESDWMGPYENGDLCTANHTWTEKETYTVKVKAKDSFDDESEWSDPMTISMPKQKTYHHPIIQFIKWILDCFALSF